MFQTPLPTELTLLILSYLPLTSLRALVLTNTEWAGFINQNQSTIYRNAAVVEGYIDPHECAVSVDEVIANPIGRRDKKVVFSQHAMRGVEGWRNFCERRKLIERSWAGRAHSQIVPSPRPAPNTSGDCDNVDVPEPAHYKRVHRIKVDEKVGITIATTQLGGLVVRDLESDAVLWELPMWYVRQYAHLEYGQGYMIFDRDDGNKEVWKRTADIEAESSPNSSSDAEHDPVGEVEFEHASAPDERQKHVVNYINHLTSNSPPVTTPTSSSSTHRAPNFKARFTPHAILHMPEITRAYRYVYPTLLVASLERAYLWDVRAGKLQQMISGIQVISVPEEEDEHSNEHGNGGPASDQGDGAEDEDTDQDDVQPDNASNEIWAQQQLMPVDIDLMDVLPRLNPARGLGQASSDHHDPPEYDIDDDIDPEEDDEFDPSSSDEDEDEDEAVQLPRFLGLVRYVDLSERHIFFAGRYLLRIFSRETGKCVMDIPSTRWRYGKWRWELASRLSAAEGDLDSYETAKLEGREVVRMPVRFSLEEYPRGSGRVVIDQFIAVHVSNDGKHLVGLLSGSRLVIIHNFESFLGPGPAVEPPPPSSKGKETSASTSHRQRRPSARPAVATAPPSSSPTSNSDSTTRMPGSYPNTSARPSTSNATTSNNHVHDHDSRTQARRRQARRQRRQRNREAREMRRRAKDAKDEEIFEHTIDVQLGAPAASSGIYLAYENGRIGVVTSNAIYIVIPPIPTPPSPSTPSGSLGIRRNRTIDIPKLEVMRLPFFSNPSWLSEVSCLMMSDTGLFVNWNPMWPRMIGDEVELAERVWEEEGEGEEGHDHDVMHWNAADDGIHVDSAGASAHQLEQYGSGISDMNEDDREAVEAVIGELLPLRRRDPEGMRQHENDRHKQMMRRWEREYEDDLIDYEQCEGERYHLFPNGDMFVTPRPRDVVESEVSTIYRVDFVPPSNQD